MAQGILLSNGGEQKNKKTLLWSNASPTSNFAQQDITLSENYTDYYYMQVCFNSSTTDTESHNVIFKSSEIANSFNYRNSFGSYLVSSSTYVRGLYYKSANILNISNAHIIMNNSGSSAYLIPTEIYGLKEMGIE